MGQVLVVGAGVVGAAVQTVLAMHDAELEAQLVVHAGGGVEAEVSAFAVRRAAGIVHPGA